MLPVDLPHVGDEESILFSWIATIRVNLLDLTLQRILNQNFPMSSTITDLSMTDIHVSVNMSVCIFFCYSREGRWCHNLAEAAGAEIVLIQRFTSC